MSGPELLKRERLAAGVRRRWLVVAPDGEEMDLAEARARLDGDAHPGVLAMIERVLFPGKAHPGKVTPELLQRLEWAGREPASDTGHFCFYPRGALVHGLLRDWLDRWLTEALGAGQIRTPMFFDWAVPAIRNHSATFDDQLYFVRGPDREREYVLRCGGDFGAFRLLERARLSYKQLPLRLYEIVESFRHLRRSRLSTVNRLRAFTMFDGHTLCTDMEQAWEEFCRLHEEQVALARAVGIRLSLQVTTQEQLYEQQRAQFVGLARRLDRPLLIELVDRIENYWLVNQHGVDEHGHRLYNLQLDARSGIEHRIAYTTRDGGRQPCVICHHSWGTVERWLFVLLERALAQEVPVLPVWLAPTQVRFIPVNDEQVAACLAQAETLRRQRIRVDVDDRGRTVDRRIAEAHAEWIPYTIVVGPRESGSAPLPVEVRGRGRVDMSAAELGRQIAGETADWPWRAQPMIRLSLRPMLR